MPVGKSVGKSVVKPKTLVASGKKVVTSTKAEEFPAPDFAVVDDPKYGPLFTFNPGSPYSFKFGRAKAKLIAAPGVIEAIREFAESN